MSDFFSRLSALIRKEMLAIFKNPKSRVFVLLPPFIQIIIFGYAATLDLTNINYGFINRDRGSARGKCSLDSTAPASSNPKRLRQMRKQWQT